MVKLIETIYIYIYIYIYMKQITNFVSIESKDACEYYLIFKPLLLIG